MSWREATSFIDPTYGQRSVFGMGDATTEEDEELDVQDEEEALEYLRLVREEASKIPTVLIARRHGPQAFPPQMVKAAAADLQKLQQKQKQQKQRRKQRRHWDDLDDGPSAAKKRRIAGQAAVPVELSYDDEEGGEDGEIREDEKEDKEEEQDEEDEKNEENEKEDEVNKAQAFYDRALYENARDDALGFYEDGAYTAAPDAADEEPLGDTSDLAALFRGHLLARFAALRAVLQQDPPAAAVAALSAKHPTRVGSLHNKSGAFARWLLLLQTTDPQAAQVAAMDRVSAFRLVRVLLQGLQVGASRSSRSSRSAKYVRWLSGGGRLSRGLQVDRRTSQWLWAVLARLPGRGELGYVEMGDIRELAKQAVLRLAHLSYDVGEGEEVEEEEEEGKGEEVEEVEEVKEEEIQGKEDDQEEGEVEEETEEGEVQEAEVTETTGDYENLEDMAIDAESEPEDEAKTESLGDAADDEMHQRATLEMVLAVAGEFYGQRDLLAFRSPWPTA